VFDLLVAPTQTVGETEKIVDVNVGLKGVKADIVKHLKSQPDITAKTLSGLLGISTRTVERHLKELKEKGVIQRAGSDKNGHWKIKSYFPVGK
jgi:predicted HTH transcriptional regulator